MPPLHWSSVSALSRLPGGRITVLLWWDQQPLPSLQLLPHVKSFQKTPLTQLVKYYAEVMGILQEKYCLCNFTALNCRAASQAKQEQKARPVVLIVWSSGWRHQFEARGINVPVKEPEKQSEFKLLGAVWRKLHPYTIPLNKRQCYFGRERLWYVKTCAAHSVTQICEGGYEGMVERKKTRMIQASRRNCGIEDCSSYCQQLL